MQRPDWPTIQKEIQEKFKDQLYEDNRIVLNDWNVKDFFGTGYFSGDMVKIVLDNAPKTELSKKSHRDYLAPAQFIAGWHTGLRSEIRWDQILDCFRPNHDLTDTLYDAMEAYVADDFTTGDEYMAAAKPLFKTALAGCHDISHEMEEWAKKFEDLKTRPNWDEAAMQIYRDEKVEIEGYMAEEFYLWENGMFFESGFQASSVERIFLSKASTVAQESDAMMLVIPL